MWTQLATTDRVGTPGNTPPKSLDTDQTITAILNLYPVAILFSGEPVKARWNPKRLYTSMTCPRVYLALNSLALRCGFHLLNLATAGFTASPRRCVTT